VRPVRFALLVLSLGTLASAEPLVLNGSFEDGREPWRGQGETKESGSAPEGEQVLEVQGLTNSWQGPRQHFAERLGNGFEYQGSFWLRPLSSAERARLGLLYQDDNGWHMALLAEVEQPVKRRWVKVVGEPVVVSWKGTLRDAKVQVIVDGDEENPPDYQVDAIEVRKGAAIEELEDRFENNDSLDAAYDLGMLSQTLSAPELYIHNATDKSGPAGDRDFFRFSFEQEAPISIRLRARSGTADLGLRLYDESGQVLVESSTKELSDERILRDVEPGVYTVSVDARGAHSFKRYELLIHYEGERKSIPVVINGSFEQSTSAWKTPGEAAEGSAIEGSYRLRVPGSDLWAGARQFLGSRVLPEASYSASFFVRTRTVVSRARLLLMCRDSGGWQSSALASVDSPQPRQWNEVISEDPLNFPCTAGFEEAQIALVIDPLRGSRRTPSYEVDHVSVVACLDGDCPPPSGRCGDGKVQEHERCDDGNTVDGDSCSSDCQELSCGPDGTTCDDFDACTIGETCQAGQCQASQKVDCSGLDALCQVGVCDPKTGSCSLQPAADGSSCDDTDFCTSTDQCLSGQCVGASKDCSQGADSCHVGVCDPTTGDCSLETLADGSSCNDGSSCTELDVCTAGVCGGTTVSCDDGDPCTADSCAPTGECLHEPGHCDGGENATIRISLAGVQVAVNDGAGTHWLHSDAQGSVSAETNPAGALVRRYLYSPFGAPQDPTAVEGKLGYVGEQHDEPFLYLNARYYDPEVGTFLEVDPITDHGARSVGLNSYAYAYQNPSSLSDPAGTCPGCDHEFFKTHADAVLALASAVHKMNDYRQDIFFPDRNTTFMNRLEASAVVGTSATVAAAGIVAAAKGALLVGAKAMPWLYYGHAEVTIASAAHSTAAAATGGALETAAECAMTGGGCDVGDFILGAATAGLAARASRPPSTGSFPAGKKGEWVRIDTLDPIHEADSFLRREGKYVSRADLLAQSIEENGFRLESAIGVIRTSAGRNIIVSGHHRAEALRRLGYTEVPVVYDPDDIWPQDDADFFLRSAWH
jgi:RHS repeat-associated protein